MGKIKLFIGCIGVCVIAAGCASKEWTEGQIAIAKNQAEEKFKKQNSSVNGELDLLLKENREYAKLLKELAVESKNLNENIKTLKQKLDYLDKTIASTKASTLKKMYSHIDSGDAEIYNKITAEQQEKIDKLRYEMDKVAAAERETKKLRAVVEKILKAYDSVK